AVAREIEATRPVVFVGPYEHHSNEVTWREGVCDVVEVELCPSGRLDLADLEAKLQDPRWVGRRKLGSFSAASNVTGVWAPVHEIARLLHRHGAPALFDFAAAGPYVEIDMNPAGDPEGRLDAVFLSPHKFLGGPGAAGLLVFDGALYPADLPPTVGGGGTVVYVTPHGHDFTSDVEARESAGTPGLFQVLRAALALEVKRAVGVVAIHAREGAHLARALARWAEAGVEVLGPADPDVRLGIVSFNMAPGSDGHYLHPRFVTALLNDLFGIQSRAGCSCAGPYGHRLLGIDEDRAERYRGLALEGRHGIKPGWCRVGFHYSMDDAEADYLIEAVAFVAAHGRRFLPFYRFDVASGAWTHRDGAAATRAFSLPAALAAAPFAATARPEDERAAHYRRALDEAQALADGLEEPDCSGVIDAACADLQYFPVLETAVTQDEDAGYCGGN
ncbi:MAG TPA: aminotransferase class V-fold PLP-dependent enzyme, partial [Rhodothermales bacterium]|nr:aminotransferase class V-fold PLP-dependent enzyme [Rhodothermales bacterium]